MSQQRHPLGGDVIAPDTIAVIHVSFIVSPVFHSESVNENALVNFGS